MHIMDPRWTMFIKIYLVLWGLGFTVYASMQFRKGIAGVHGESRDSLLDFLKGILCLIAAGILLFFAWWV